MSAVVREHSGRREACATEAGATHQTSGKPNSEDRDSNASVEAFSRKDSLLGRNSEASQLSTSVIDRPGRAGDDVTTPRRPLGCPGTSREPNL